MVLSTSVRVWIQVLPKIFYYHHTWDMITRRQWAGYDPWYGLIVTEVGFASINRQVGCPVSFASNGFFSFIFFSRALELCCIERPHRWTSTKSRKPKERVLSLFLKGLKSAWLLFCPRKEVYCCQDLLCSVLQTCCSYSARSLMCPAP